MSLVSLVEWNVSLGSDVFLCESYKIKQMDNSTRNFIISSTAFLAVSTKNFISCVSGYRISYVSGYWIRSTL